jgi:hypothetical protein
VPAEVGGRVWAGIPGVSSKMTGAAAKVSETDT